MKNPLTPAGIYPATFRFVAQHLNHCAAVVPWLKKVHNLFMGKAVYNTLIESGISVKLLCISETSWKVRTCRHLSQSLLRMNWNKDLLCHKISHLEGQSKLEGTKWNGTHQHRVSANGIDLLEKKNLNTVNKSTSFIGRNNEFGIAVNVEEY